MMRLAVIVRHLILDVDTFNARFADVRQRFAATLSGKVDDCFAALPTISNENDVAVETIVFTHRNLHSMCGIAPTVGFPATGKAARAAETVLSAAAQSRRSLTSAELAGLISTLKGLRAAILSELPPGAH